MIHGYRRREVVRFGVIMQERLSANNHKGGWKKEDERWLFSRMGQEAWELLYEMQKPDRDKVKIAHEAADVANFAMMIADVCGGMVVHNAK